MAAPADRPQAKPRKQEQEDAATEVTEVAPGILRLQLPINFSGLGHVNCYALEDEDGFTLVDPGMPGPANWKSVAPMGNCCSGSASPVATRPWPSSTVC